MPAEKRPFKLVSRESNLNGTIIDVQGVKVGGKKIVVMAGPCAVESEEQLLETAIAVKKAGATVLRASAFKPRSSPYSFQGLGKEGLEIIKRVGEKTGLVTETEVVDPRDVEAVAAHVDILRVGARNMQNFGLLKEVAKAGKPVILKNGISATMEEFLLAAEYILNEGNPNVILCYRGIRSFEPEIRFPLDAAMVPLLKESTHLPVIVDPSHSAGKASLVPAVGRAAIAAGADGLIVEVHPAPESALSDREQQLTPMQFLGLMKSLGPVARAVGREL
jgi:3-deoxy-7-phosphoheptulonate synthase